MDIELGLLTAIMVIVLGQSAAIIGLWKEIGKLRQELGCPFGKCPVFERARGEAAPLRDFDVGSATSKTEPAL